MLLYIIVGGFLYFALLVNLPLLPNRSTGITHLKAMRGLLLIPVVGYLFYLAIARSLNVGTDYSMYHSIFVNGSYTDRFDLLIVMIYDFARNEGDFLLFTSIITGLFIIFNLVAIQKLTYNFLVSFALFVLSFYFFFIFNGMRQAVASSIIFLAIYFIQKEQLKTADFLAYFLLITIAMQFHISAMFMFPLILLRFFRVNESIVLIAFAFTVFGYFTPFVKNVLAEFLLLFDFYVQKYAHDPDSFFAVSKEKKMKQFIAVIIQYFFLYYSFKLSPPKGLYEKFLVNYYLVFLFLYIASGVEAVDRIQYYFYPSIILFYDYLVHKISLDRGNENYSKFLRVKRVVALASISFWFLYFIVRIMQGTGGITPYEFMS